MAGCDEAVRPEHKGAAQDPGQYLFKSLSLFAADGAALKPPASSVSCAF
jgi:hypothetical protein